MQSPEITFRIEMFGTMVSELKYWHTCLSDEPVGNSLDYCESKFEEMLAACRDFRNILLEDLNNYIEDCKEHGEPISLDYYRVFKELKDIEF